MGRLESASLLEASEGLTALFRGEEGDEADFGALYLAKALQGLMRQG